MSILDEHFEDKLDHKLDVYEHMWELHKNLMEDLVKKIRDEYYKARRENFRTIQYRALYRPEIEPYIDFMELYHGMRMRVEWVHPHGGCRPAVCNVFMQDPREHDDPRRLWDWLFYVLSKDAAELRKERECFYIIDLDNIYIEPVRTKLCSNEELNSFIEEYPQWA